MCKKSISMKMYDALSWHVTHIESKKEMLFKEYYNEETEESKKFEAFFKAYLLALTTYLDSVAIGPEGKNECPFVIIGSIVEVFDHCENDSYRYHIVLPYSGQSGSDVDYASCLSPLGSALLFKTLNEKVNVEIPTGTLHYTIKKITFPGSPTGTVQEPAVPDQKLSFGN